MNLEEDLEEPSPGHWEAKAFWKLQMPQEDIASQWWHAPRGGRFQGLFSSQG